MRCAIFVFPCFLFVVCVWRCNPDVLDVGYLWVVFLSLWFLNEKFGSSGFFASSFLISMCPKRCRCLALHSRLLDVGYRWVVFLSLIAVFPSKRVGRK